jgi:hypothetical protein
MKEHPILFSSEMVRAILNSTNTTQTGRSVPQGKTQTRRAMRPQPRDEFMPAVGRYCPSMTDRRTGEIYPGQEIFGASDEEEGYRCKYGEPGDRLWVRESYYQYGHWEKVEGVKTKTGRMKWKFVPDKTPAATEYLFDPPSEYRKGRHHQDPYTPAFHKRLGRFMPRKASRITLEIVNVRVERLQNISESDARAEGVEVRFHKPGEFGIPKPCATGSVDLPGDRRIHTTAIGCYSSLWESINGKGSWAANPWVWVICFKKC